jgi:hypothetical protein
MLGGWRGSVFSFMQFPRQFFDRSESHLSLRRGGITEEKWRLQI